MEIPQLDQEYFCIVNIDEYIMAIWKEKLKNTTEKPIEKNIEELIQWNASLITKSFQKKQLKYFLITKKIKSADYGLIHPNLEDEKSEVNS